MVHVPFVELFLFSSKAVLSAVKACRSAPKALERFILEVAKEKKCPRGLDKRVELVVEFVEKN